MLVANQKSGNNHCYNQNDPGSGFPGRRLRALSDRLGVFMIDVALHGLENPFQILAPRSRSELSTTEIDEALIAKAANIGLIKIPKNGNRRPAATGTPLAL